LTANKVHKGLLLEKFIVMTALYGTQYFVVLVFNMRVLASLELLEVLVLAQLRRARKQIGLMILKQEVKQILEVAKTHIRQYCPCSKLEPSSPIEL